MNILVTIPLEEPQKRRLEEAAPDRRFDYCRKSGLTSEHLKQADIILGNVPLSLLNGQPHLKWLQLNNAGTDGYCETGILAPGTILTNASGTYGLAISEHMIGSLLMLKKKLHIYYKNQLAHRWQPELDGGMIAGSTTLIIGLGDIGRTFAQKMDALGSYVIGIRKSDAPKPAYVQEQYHLDELYPCLTRADIIAVCLPDNSETRRVLDQTAFSQMKAHAVLINVGRGKAIDTAALMTALTAGRVGGACLDVCDPEPLPQDHPLWELPNVLITPHISGKYKLPETLVQIVDLFIKNLSRYVNGQSLINVVNRETGYPG